MIPRIAISDVDARLRRLPAVALIGPRQVGKTTLAHQIAGGRRSVYLDLERPGDLARLSDPELYFAAHPDELIILDEVHRTPGLFRTLRGVIDERRRGGQTSGQFLLLGSASIDLLKQTSESLAGRIDFVELTPLTLPEVGETHLEVLWRRGGFPDSFLAADDDASLIWRQSFVRTYLERDIPQLGPRIPAETLRRFWTMLAHQQGTLMNASAIARSLGINGKTVASYLGLLVDLLLVRRLPPYYVNVGKRLVRSPKVYVRDSGIAHALLGIRTHDDLLAHPICGMSWEGMIIENIASAAPPLSQLMFYRTVAGAEVDLLLVLPGGDLWAIEIRRGARPTVTRGLATARNDLGPARTFVVYSGTERFPLTEGVEAISVGELLNEVAALA